MNDHGNQHDSQRRAIEEFDGPPASVPAFATSPHVAERIARAQEMLSRLGQRPNYEPNYAGEKLSDAARSCIEALALLGDDRSEIERMTSRAWERGHDHREALRRNARVREAMAAGLACVRCGDRGGTMQVAGAVAGDSGRQVFEHADCRQDGLAVQIKVDEA